MSVVLFPYVPVVTIRFVSQFIIPFTLKVVQLTLIQSSIKVIEGVSVIFAPYILEVTKPFVLQFRTEDTLKYPSLKYTVCVFDTLPSVIDSDNMRSP